MSDEVLPPLSSLVTFTGLCGFVVLSLIRGWIIPRATVDKIVERMERAIDDRDSIIHELRLQNAALDQRNDLLAIQVYQLVSSGYVAPAPIRAVATTQGAQGFDPGTGETGLGDSPSQSSPPPGRSQARGDGKTGRRGSARR